MCANIIININFRRVIKYYLLPIYIMKYYMFLWQILVQKALLEYIACYHCTYFSFSMMESHYTKKGWDQYKKTSQRKQGTEILASTLRQDEE